MPNIVLKAKSCCSQISDRLTLHFSGLFCYCGLCDHSSSRKYFSGPVQNFSPRALPVKPLFLLKLRPDCFSRSVFTLSPSLVSLNRRGKERERERERKEPLLELSRLVPANVFPTAEQRFQIRVGEYTICSRSWLCVRTLSLLRSTQG